MHTQIYIVYYIYVYIIYTYIHIYIYIIYFTIKTFKNVAPTICFKVYWFKVNNGNKQWKH